MSDKTPLTVKDLFEILKAMDASRSGQIVCIPNGKVGIGGTAVTNIIHAAPGFDWNHHKFILTPENRMVEASQEPRKDWKEQATKWALTRMPKNWNVEKATADEVHSFYCWMLMFIRDNYSIYHKHL